MVLLQFGGLIYTRIKYINGYEYKLNFPRIAINLLQYKLLIITIGTDLYLSFRELTCLSLQHPHNMNIDGNSFSVAVKIIDSK